MTQSFYLQEFSKLEKGGDVGEAANGPISGISKSCKLVLPFIFNGFSNFKMVTGPIGCFLSSRY